MWKANGKCAVLLGMDLDAETLQIGFGVDTASPISRGKYGAYVGAPRVLKFLKEREMKITWFIPGWVAENYPWLMEEILKDGHEIAHHGWLHHDPNSMSVEQEREEFERGYEAIKKYGTIPVGYRSPAFDLGPGTIKALQDFNYLYDTTMMAYESPYEIYENGKDTGLLELPISWDLDDAPYYMFFMTKPTFMSGLRNPDDVVSMWKKEFDWAYKDSGFYDLTLHPQFTGRGLRLDALGELLDYINKFPDVWFATHEQVARAYRNDDMDLSKKFAIDLTKGYPDPRHNK